MKIGYLFLLVLPLAALADDAKTIQGVWYPVQWTLAGSSTPPPTIGTMKLTLKGDLYEFIEGPTVDSGKTILKSKESPKAMDIVGLKGPNKGKTIPAIYRIEANRLIICYGLDGKRPAKFESPAKKLVLLVEYGRKPLSAK